MGTGNWSIKYNFANNKVPLLVGNVKNAQYFGCTKPPGVFIVLVLLFLIMYSLKYVTANFVFIHPAFAPVSANI